jgi:glycerophosphoryl diester phosphodiesterase
LVFAHRGGCALGPENTLAAFDLGLAAGADGIELDVHLSADGVAVVHHDETLERTTSGSGPLAAHTAAELARLDAGCRFELHGDFRFRNQGIGIPSLADVLTRYRDTRVIIEMKVDSAEMGEAVARDIRAADAVERVCVAGYGRRSAEAARAALPGAPASACRPEAQLAFYRTLARWPVRRVRYHAYQLPEYRGLYHVVTPRFIRYAHEEGLKVQVWTVDEEADMRRLLGWGADALITNRPDLATQVIASRL